MPQPPITFNRRHLLQFAGASFLLGVSRLGHADAPDIVAVRSWPSETYTRITLESNGALRYRYFMVDNPDRLVIDLEGIQLSPLLRGVGQHIQNDPYIHNARAGQFSPEKVRIVFDLKKKIEPQVFRLDPVAEYKHRLVIDLFPTHSDDPLLALLNEFNHGSLESRPFPPRDPPTQTTEKPKTDASPERIASTEKPKKKPKTDKKTTHKPRSSRSFIVMIDPGHGGEDPGAIGPSGAKEKDIALAIARRLKKRIDGQPRMRALLTRNADIFLPLSVRVAKARQAKADLFISIHADAFIQPSARGSSVFTLSEKGATSTAAKWLAETQNDADLIGGVNINTKDRYLAHTLLDLTQTATINDSLRVGGSVLRQLGTINRLHKRHVEQAGFAVLKAPDIPSILVETAFISNPEEESKLINPKHQDKVAHAILQGIRSYAQHHIGQKNA